MNMLYTCYSLVGIFLLILLQLERGNPKQTDSDSEGGARRIPSPLERKLTWISTCLLVSSLAAGIAAVNLSNAAWDFLPGWENNLFWLALLLYLPVPVIAIGGLAAGIGHHREYSGLKWIAGCVIFFLLFLYPMPAWMEARFRSHYGASRIRMRDLAILLDDHRRLTQEPPQSLRSIPGLEDADVLVDPYAKNGSLFGYRIDDASGGVSLFSVGPDRIAGWETGEPLIEYDPSNGSISRGDIVWTLSWDRDGTLELGMP